MKARSSLFRGSDGTDHTATFVLMCCLFLLWGLCNGMIDVLNKHFQNSLGVSKAESAFVQGFWYSGYFLMALPSGWIARRFGYRGGILMGLCIVIIGALLFVPVTGLHASKNVMFYAFLCPLFLMAAGLTFLETVCNPYTTVLGSPEAAVSRINLAQSCNAVGWILGPILGSTFILSTTEKINTSNEKLYLPYLVVAGIVAVLVLAVRIVPVPDIQAASGTAEADSPRVERPLVREPHFLLAIASQFLYCAGQIGIFSFFINYVKDDRYMPALPAWLAGCLPANMKYLHLDAWHITEYGAGVLLSVAFGLFTAGRFSGSYILRFRKAHTVLGQYALINVVLMLLVVLGLGWVSVIALMASFFFMSIMYPTHFALGIHGLGEKTKLAASFMVTAVVGGAIMPIFMGWLAERYSMRVGFLMPLACFVCVMLYGFNWPRLYRRPAGDTHEIGSRRLPSL